MQGPSWIALLERIPAKLHDSLALTLVTGEEILMQSVLRLESDFGIIRGRMSGSTDAGRVLIVPYDQIVNMAFTKRMLVADVQAVFGETLETAGANGEAAKGSDGETETGDASGAAEGSPRGVAVEMRTILNTAPPPAPSAVPAKNQASAPPSKSILLARLRARLAEQGK
jgi:hypothetical protein